MEIPILSGIYADNTPDYRIGYPVNLLPVPAETGISRGYLKPAPGLVQNGTGPGLDRGGINWNGTLYRVCGSKLVAVQKNGNCTILGDVGGGAGDFVTLDYSFDRLAIASNGNLFLWNGVNLTQNVDPDLGPVADMVWVDGYFMTTDGNSLVITELSDPLQVNPLKYGSSEADPDPIIALKKIRTEVYAINRYSIEVFDNVGGQFFPFQKIDSAHIRKGALGVKTVCVFMDTLAFIGSGRNEAPSVYIGSSAQSVKIATREIDQILHSYSEDDLSKCIIEAITDNGHSLLLMHLPDRCLVYDAAASQKLGTPVWCIFTSALMPGHFTRYRAHNFVWAYDRWNVGDTESANIGYWDDATGHHYGMSVRWEFATPILYAEGRGLLFHQIELVALTGRVTPGLDIRIATSYSTDGTAWSQDAGIQAGTAGDTLKRLIWLRQGNMRRIRLQRFRGDSHAHISFARLEAVIEPMSA